jgi:hypothetical protein
LLLPVEEYTSKHKHHRIEDTETISPTTNLVGGQREEWEITYRPNLQIWSPESFEDALYKCQFAAEITRVEHGAIAQAQHLCRHATSRPHVQLASVVLLAKKQFGRPVACRADFEVLGVSWLRSRV